MEERTLQSGDDVFRAGDEAEELLLLVDGHVRLEIKGVSMGRTGPGDVLGGASLVSIGNRECDAIAETPLALLVLSRESYLRLRSDAPQLALDLQEAILREFAGVVRGSVCEPAQP
jgi:CRP-like cAMP-binding protein